MKTTSPYPQPPAPHTVGQLAALVLDAARAALPGVRITCASLMAHADIRPDVFLHATTDDGRDVCGNGETFSEAALNLWRKLRAPAPVMDAEENSENSP